MYVTFVSKLDTNIRLLLLIVHVILTAISDLEAVFPYAVYIAIGEGAEGLELFYRCMK